MQPKIASFFAILKHNFGANCSDLKTYFAQNFNLANQNNICYNKKGMENYYKKLGVSRFASKQEIRRAYIEILKTYHPDVYKGDIDYAQKITADANIAFEFLSNPVKKLELDEYLQKMELEELNKKTTQNNSKQNQSNSFGTNQTHTKNTTQPQSDFSKKNTQTQTSNQHSKPKFKFDFFAKRTDKSKANNKKQTKNVANDSVIRKQVKEKISNRQGDMGRLKLNALIGLIIVAILALIIVLIVVI